MVRRNFELTCKMREDLMKAYREVCAKCHSQHEAYVKTVRHPAARFYITPKQAYNILRMMVRGGFSVIENMPPTNKRMYMDLFGILQKQSQKKEFIGKSLWFCCQFLVTQPAPEFYMSEYSFRDTFSHVRRFGRDYHDREIRKNSGGKKPSC